MEDSKGTSTKARDEVVSNQDILENVFKFLPFSDLKSTRLVSRLWRDSARPIFQRKSILNLEGGRRNCFLGTFEFSWKPLNCFLEAFGPVGSRQVIFRNYKLARFILEGESEVVMDAFWEKFGPSMENLELFEVTMVGVEVVRDVLFNLAPKLKNIVVRDCIYYEAFQRGQEEVTLHVGVAPLDGNVKVNRNLESFSFYKNNDEWIKEFSSSLPIHWEEIFLAFPNLRNLTIYDVRALDTDKILEAASSLKMKNPNSFQLEKLNIFNAQFSNDVIQPATMDLLLSLKLSLKELSIDLGESENIEKIVELFHQQKDVQKLVLYRFSPLTGFPFEIVFNHLRHLEMPEIMESMSFLQYMPNLTTLALCNPCECEPPFGPTNVIYNTCLTRMSVPLQTKIKTLKIEYDISTEDVKKLIILLPSVSEAKLYLDNKGFRSVCVGWPQLESLEVYLDNLTTEGITGVYELKVRNRRIDTFIPQREYHPKNITCLKNLRQFVMVNYNKPTGIDDVCVEEGFLKLQHLNYLDICSFDISMDGWTKLFNWDQLRTLKASNGDKDWEGVKKFTKI